MTEGVGTLVFMISVEIVNVFRSNVFKIMLAKPTIIVTIIPKETMPPVNVLY